jgi:hypothetical protein
VVLLDAFDQFEQTIGDINVSLDSRYEGCRDSFGDRKPNQKCWLLLANSFVFYGVRSVLSIIGPETIHFCQGAV